MRRFKVIIIGGGAAGLACAVTLTRHNIDDVLILEAADRPGKKLASSGNGQGNIGNTDMDISHYRSGNLSAVADIACAQTSQSVCDRVFGPMLYKTGSMGRIYPQSLQASSLVDIFMSRLKGTGVRTLLSTRADGAEAGFKVRCGGEEYFSDYLVIAAGGKAQKQFKTDGSAYALAQSFGHTLTPLYPSIVQLKTDTDYIKNLKGIRCNCFVGAYVGGNLKKSVTADVIFTDYGVSGNAIFYLSSQLIRGGELKIDFLPDCPADILLSTLQKRQKEGTPTPEILRGILHNQIARAVIGRVGSDDILKIAAAAKCFTLNVKGTLGFDYAQVTSGGVNMSEVSSGLESKLCKNLFFAGEILDVDGDCGGYNLHWAFASGERVAEEISRRYEKA